MKALKATLILAFILSACHFDKPPLEAPLAGQPVAALVPTPESTQDDTLVICIGGEPESLYLYGSNQLATQQVLQAVYDGPFDNRAYNYQPVITTKLPNLSDGDAALHTVTVGAGDTVVADDGAVVKLEEGIVLRPSGCYHPSCAVSYTGGEFKLDKLQVTFHLRPNLTWSDGTPLTAHDSVYSFNLNADPETPTSKYTIERTERYEALDDNTLLWVGLPGFTDATYFLNLWTPLPEHVWGQLSAAELLNAPLATEAPLGWGAYAIVGWNPGENIILQRNPHYYRASEGLPYFDHLIFRFMKDNPNGSIAAILSGECDIVDDSVQLTDQIDTLIELENSGQIYTNIIPSNAWEHISLGIVPAAYDDGYNPTTGDRPDLLGDVKTRRALALCLDRQSVADTLMYHHSEVLHSYLPSQHPLYNPDVLKYPYDPAAGIFLLEEVGWVLGADGIRVAQDVAGVPDGTRLELDYWTTNAIFRQQATQILAESAAACGIKINLQYWVPAEFFADGPDGPVFGRRFDMAQFGWLTTVQPPCDLFLGSQIVGPSEDGFCGWNCANPTGWSDPSYDLACNQALNALPGQPAYRENHLLAQDILARQLPIIPLFQRISLAAARPDICGFTIDPTSASGLWNIEAFGYGDWCEG